MLTSELAAPSDRRRALLALALLVPFPSLGALAAMVVPATAGTDLGKALFAAAKAWLFLMPALWWWLVVRRPISLSPPRRGGFVVACVLGVLIGAVIWVTYALIGPKLIDVEFIRDAAARSGLDSMTLYIGFAIYTCTINAMLEEYVWRWFVFEQCRAIAPGLGGWIAVVLSATLFTAHHVVAMRAQFNWSVTLLGSSGVFIGGVVWSWCYLRYRSIWPGYVSHVIVDIVVFAIGWHLIFG